MQPILSHGHIFTLFVIAKVIFQYKLDNTLLEHISDHHNLTVAYTTHIIKIV